MSIICNLSSRQMIFSDRTKVKILYMSSTVCHTNINLILGFSFSGDQTTTFRFIQLSFNGTPVISGCVVEYTARRHTYRY